MVASLLAALAGSAIATRVQTSATERRNPRRGQRVAIRGQHVHLMEQGSGPPVLLIHGNGVTADDWRISGLYESLSQRFQVLAPDRAGFGYSSRRGGKLSPAAQADLFAALLRRRTHEPAIIVGHSIGVQTALCLALDHPELVRGLVLISGYAFPTTRLDSVMAQIQTLPLLGPVWRNTLAQPIGRLLLGLVAARLFGPRPAPHDYAKGPLSMGLRPAQYRAATNDGADMPANASSLAPRLGSIRAPTIVLAGEADLVVDPNRQSRRIAAAIPGARYIPVRNAGHMAHHAAPALVEDSIAFLSRHTPRFQRTASPNTAKAGASARRPTAAATP